MKNKKCEGIDCAWCMCIECPREKDTTMTDKEQIMIDGVDVSGCRYYLRNIHKSCGQGLVDCEGKDCMFKQLARLKEENERLKYNNDYQVGALERTIDELREECEELKRKVELMMDCPDCKVDEYKKAIEEIEEECNYAPMCDTEFSQRVLDIINKTKDGE